MMKKDLIKFSKRALFRAFSLVLISGVVISCGESGRIENKGSLKPSKNDQRAYGFMLDLDAKNMSTDNNFNRPLEGTLSFSQKERRLSLNQVITLPSLLNSKALSQNKSWLISIEAPESLHIKEMDSQCLIKIEFEDSSPLQVEEYCHWRELAKEGNWFQSQTDFSGAWGGDQDARAIHFQVGFSTLEDQRGKLEFTISGKPKGLEIGKTWSVKEYESEFGYLDEKILRPDSQSYLVSVFELKNLENRSIRVKSSKRAPVSFVKTVDLPQVYQKKPCGVRKEKLRDQIRYQGQGFLRGFASQIGPHRSTSSIHHYSERSLKPGEKSLFALYATGPELSSGIENAVPKLEAKHVILCVDRRRCLSKKSCRVCGLNGKRDKLCRRKAPKWRDTCKKLHSGAPLPHMSMDSCKEDGINWGSGYPGFPTNNEDYYFYLLKEESYWVGEDPVAKVIQIESKNAPTLVLNWSKQVGNEEGFLWKLNPTKTSFSIDQ